MAFILADRVKETTIVVGTGAATLLGAQTGYQSFSAGVGASNTTYYTIADQSGSNWEVGYGTLDATGLILTRTTVISSSNSGSAVTFTTGTKDVWCDYTAKKAVIQDSLGLVTVPVLQTSSTSSVTPVLTFNGATTNYAAGAAVSGSYLQTILQNSSATAGASTNYVLSNNLGTDSTYYGEFGMNSSVYSASTPSDFFSINNGVYFSGHDGDITVGSGNGYKTYLAWGTTGDKAHVINASGALGLNTNITGTTNFGTSGQVLTSAGSAATPTWTTPTTGTVTSVGLSAPSIFTVGNSPVTSSGTLALTYSGTALPVANGGTGVTTSTGTGSTVLNTSPTLTTPAITGGTISNLTQELIGQSYDQGTGVLQVTGNSSFNGAVVDKSLNLQGGNNLFAYSQDLSQSSVWVPNNMTAAANQTTAPDGTNTGNTLTPAPTTVHLIQNSSTTLGNTYTYSVYAKQNTYAFIQLGASGSASNSWVNFNLTTGAVGNVGNTPISYSITNAGNGWYRCIMTFSPVGAGALYLSVLNSDINSRNPSYLANGSSNVYVWGAQLELGLLASAYTPTTTVAITTTNNINVPSGQVIVQKGTAILPAVVVGGANTGIYQYDASNLGFAVNSAAAAKLDYTGAFNLITSTPYFYFNSLVGITTDGANILAQRFTTNAQTFRLYNTYTSTSLGEWLSVDWSTTANTATIATKANGAGVVRTLATGNPLVISTGYTVSTLPTGVVGMRAYVTDALLPTYLGTLTGGGTVKCPVFYNGTAWVSA